MKPRSMVYLGLIALSAVMFTGIRGCNSKPKIIDKVNVGIADNLEVVDVALSLSKSIETDFGGSFDVTFDDRNYGRLYLEPWTPNVASRLGFELNTEIFNDPGFNNPLLFEPTQFFPNGERLPSAIDRAMAMVKLKNEDSSGNPIERNVDVYTYIDVKHREWLGIAVSLKKANKKYFPEGLVLTQYLARDSQKRPRVAVSVFGPRPGVEGHAGISVFANVKAFMAAANQNKRVAARMIAYELRKASDPVFEGPRGNYYKKNRSASRTLESAVTALIESNNRKAKH